MNHHLFQSLQECLQVEESFFVLVFVIAFCILLRIHEFSPLSLCILHSTNKLSGQEFDVQKMTRGGKVGTSFPGNGA